MKNWLRTRAVRRWVRRQEAAGLDPNAYEIQGYIRRRWGLSQDDATQIMLDALDNGGRAPMTTYRTLRKRARCGLSVSTRIGIGYCILIALGLAWLVSHAT